MTGKYLQTSKWHSAHGTSINSMYNIHLRRSQTCSVKVCEGACNSVLLSVSGTVIQLRHNSNLSPSTTTPTLHVTWQKCKHILPVAGVLNDVKTFSLQIPNSAGFTATLTLYSVYGVVSSSARVLLTITFNTSYTRSTDSITAHFSAKQWQQRQHN